MELVQGAEFQCGRVWFVVNKPNLSKDQRAKENSRVAHEIKKLHTSGAYEYRKGGLPKLGVQMIGLSPNGRELVWQNCDASMLYFVNTFTVLESNGFKHFERRLRIYRFNNFLIL